MVFKSIFHNETSENTYLVYDEETKNGIIIDPGCKMEKIENLIKNNNSQSSKLIHKSIMFVMFL